MKWPIWPLQCSVEGLIWLPEEVHLILLTVLLQRNFHLKLTVSQSYILLASHYSILYICMFLKSTFLSYYCIAQILYHYNGQHFFFLIAGCGLYSTHHVERQENWTPSLILLISSWCAGLKRYPITLYFLSSPIISKLQPKVSQDRLQITAMDTPTRVWKRFFFNFKQHHRFSIFEILYFIGFTERLINLETHLICDVIWAEVMNSKIAKCGNITTLVIH